MNPTSRSSCPDVISVAVVHRDPLVHAGLTATLALQACFDVKAMPAGQESIDIGISRQAVGADVVVTDYDTALFLVDALAGEPGSPHVSQPRVMVVSHRNRESEIRYALNRGVRGYVLLDCALDDMVRGVRAVHQGHRHLDKSAAARVVESLGQPMLTAREIAVLRLIAVGHVNKAIASQLNISLGTVKTHVKSILSKLDAKTRTEAAAIAGRRGLIAEG